MLERKITDTIYIDSIIDLKASKSIENITIIIMYNYI